MLGWVILAGTFPHSHPNTHRLTVHILWYLLPFPPFYKNSLYYIVISLQCNFCMNFKVPSNTESQWRLTQTYSGALRGTHSDYELGFYLQRAPHVFRRVLESDSGLRLSVSTYCSICFPIFLWSHVIGTDRFTHLSSLRLILASLWPFDVFVFLLQSQWCPWRIPIWILFGFCAFLGHLFWTSVLRSVSILGHVTKWH